MNLRHLASHGVLRDLWVGSMWKYAVVKWWRDCFYYVTPWWVVLKVTFLRWNICGSVRWFGWLDLIGLVLTCSCIQACICAHVSCCMPCDSGLIDLSLSDFFLIHPLLLPPSWQRACPIEKTSLLGFIGFSTRMTIAAKQNEKHVRSLAWTTSKVDQSCDTLKTYSPTKSRFANSLDICPQIFAIWGCLLVNYGEKQFKPSDSWEESGRFVASGELW